MFPREAFALCEIVALPERAIEQAVKVHVFVDQLSRDGCLALVKKISPPEFFRRQVHGTSYLIHVPFRGEEGLRRAETAKRAVRRSIGRHGPGMNSHVGAGVGSRCVNRSAR